MPATHSIAPAVLASNLFEFDGVTGFALNLGSPAPVHLPVVNAVLAAAFTPTATTGTLSNNDELFIGTGLTYRSAKVVSGNGIDTSKPFHVRAFARRKPGTTGAIVANLVQLKCGSPLVELGRFNVLAAAAGEDPVSGFIDLPMVAGDTRWELADEEEVAFAITTVDTDLEICFAAYGESL